jgi:hypothetical protein
MISGGQTASMAKRAHQGVVQLTFLLYKCPEDKSQFVAHCLEMDVVAVEETKPKAIDLLKELIEDLLNTATADGTLAKVFRPAPPKYWEMLASAKRYDPPAKTVKHRIASSPVRSVGYALAAV